jgi:hypothetical protein
MSAVTTGSVSDGDERVKADDGLDDATIIIAAPTMAARMPPLRRENIAISSGFSRPQMTIRACG